MVNVGGGSGCVPYRWDHVGAGGGLCQGHVRECDDTPSIARSAQVRETRSPYCDVDIRNTGRYKKSHPILPGSSYPQSEPTRPASMNSTILFPNSRIARPRVALDGAIR